jgi:RNA polymerase sigma factor (sigma-70 family)
MNTEALTSTAFAEAFHADFGKTMWFVVSRGVAPDTAEDIAQAAWARGWERRHQLREVKAILAWINVIALNLLRAAARRGKPTTDLEAAPEGSYTMNLVALDARHLLEICRSGDRELLKRHYVEGCTIQEIAKEAGMNPSSVRVRLFRARRAARRMLRVC